MSENVNFIQGSKENYNAQEMRGGVYFCKDTKEIMLNGDEYGRDSNWALLDSVEDSILTQNTEPVLSSDNVPLVPKSDTYQASGVQISELPEQLNLQDDDYFVIQGINGTQKVSSDTIKTDIKNDINIIYLPWNTDYKTTRLQVPQGQRRQGLKIRYFINNTELTEETYKSTNYSDTSWQRDNNWKYDRFKGFTNDLNITPTDTRYQVYYLTTQAGTFTNLKSGNNSIKNNYSNIRKLYVNDLKGNWNITDYDFVTSSAGADYNWVKVSQGMIAIIRTESTQEQKTYTVKVLPNTYVQGINCTILNQNGGVQIKESEYTVQDPGGMIWVMWDRSNKTLVFQSTTNLEYIMPSNIDKNKYYIIGYIGSDYGANCYFPFSGLHIQMNPANHVQYPRGFGDSTIQIPLDQYSFNRIQNHNGIIDIPKLTFKGECLLDLQDTGEDNIWYLLGIIPDDEADSISENTRTFNFTNIDLSVSTTKQTTAFAFFKKEGVWQTAEVPLSYFLRYQTPKYYIENGWYVLVNDGKGLVDFGLGDCYSIESTHNKSYSDVLKTPDLRANIVILRNDKNQYAITQGNYKGVNFYGAFTSDFNNKNYSYFERCSFSLPDWYTANTSTYFMNFSFYDRDYCNVTIKNCTFNIKKLFECIYIDLGDNIEITGCNFNCQQLHGSIRVNQFKTSALIRGNIVNNGTTGIFFGSTKSIPLSNGIIENNIVRNQTEESISFDGFGNNSGLNPVIGNGNIESARNDENGRLVIICKLYKAKSSLDGTKTPVEISSINNWTDYFFTFNRNTGIDGTICHIYSYDPEEGSLTLDIFEDASKIRTSTGIPDLGNYKSTDSVVGVQSGFFDCVVRNNIIKSDVKDYCTAISIFLNVFNTLIENNKVYRQNCGLHLAGARCLIVQENHAWGNKVINNTFMNCNEVAFSSLYGNLPQYNNIVQGNIFKNVKAINGNAQKNFVFKDNIFDNVENSSLKFCESYLPDEANLRPFESGTIYNKFTNDPTTGELQRVDPYIVAADDSGTLKLVNLNK